ncbi:MAG: hypothetical protein IT548_17120 [Alphaproteobacteria bacterium]|nr:hypothetical protein [Alphaproteobacteria bacterium]
MRRATILAVALLAFAGGANAITFDFDATHPDPFADGSKCQTPELASSGGYVYQWPSKYDLVFSPWDYPQFIWRCDKSGFLSFPSDFELKPTEKEAVAAFLKTKGSDPLKGLELIGLARRMEEIYAVRETDDEFKAFMLRYMAWQLRADPEADAYRRKALGLHKKMLDGGTLSGFALQETLFILGHYSYRFGDKAAAQAYFDRIKTVEVKDEDTGQTVKGSEYLEGLAAEVLAGQADDTVRFKSDTP